jgi:hypothetical protein
MHAPPVPLQRASKGRKNKDSSITTSSSINDNEQTSFQFLNRDDIQQSRTSSVGGNKVRSEGALYSDAIARQKQLRAYTEKLQRAQNRRDQRKQHASQLLGLQNKLKDQRSQVQCAKSWSQEMRDSETSHHLRQSNQDRLTVSKVTTTEYNMHIRC